MSLDRQQSTGSTCDRSDQLTWLRRELAVQIAEYKRRRRRDKRKAFALQMSTVVLSASITVLLGLRVAGTVGQRLSDVALILGALATVLAAMEAFFHHRDLWVLRTATLRRLESLDRRVSYYEVGLGDDAASVADMEHYFAQLDGILAQDFSGWRDLQRPVERPPKEGSQGR